MEKVMLTERLARQIRVLRIEQKYPSRYVANKIGVSTSTYSRYENGGMVTITRKALNGLERVYKTKLVTEDDLYTRIYELEEENRRLRAELKRHNHEEGT